MTPLELCDNKQPRPIEFSSDLESIALPGANIDGELERDDGDWIIDLQNRRKKLKPNEYSSADCHDCLKLLQIGHVQTRFQQLIRPN
ncbi:hypothetical protein HanXRQr2_Chr09g0367211 [Helianthus annuus]|uniref:Uncharacterized protein n=1 Tax=Helianthus annuus TaxID=4232 RepID=A0A9K3N6Z0_HELAN|nr:hypothetical protein HanXRQr2_Chr09g0367211 [Helianthus annuus]